MKTFKAQLLTATSISLFAASAAQAVPVSYPAAEIRGNGASTVAVVVTKENNCLGNATNANLGFGTGLTQDINEHRYAPITPSLSNPIFDCGTPAASPERSIQPNITAYYISTGSGQGRFNWSKFVATSGITTNPFGSWSNIQYAFSEAPISAINLTDYNNTGAGVVSPRNAGAGNAIQIPFYTVPVAVAYAPVYGKRDTAGGIVPLSLNVKSTFVSKDGTGAAVGGLRMKKSTYCAIFNGTITNFNDAALTTDNGGQSLRDPNDDLARWNSAGVPIKLIGRSDNSGGTSLFTRHISAACGGDFNAGGTDQLPAARKSTAIYDKTTGALLSGTHDIGKFGLSNGSDGVAQTTGQAVPDPALGSGATTLGGFLGYVGADWVRPSSVGTATPALFAAALQQGTSTVFKMPTAANATAAFGTAYLPPESNTNGTYNSTVTANGLRTDPTAWVLPAGATDRLANPTLGYPIVGTANALLYTCYTTPAKRMAIVALAAFNFGKITKDSTDAKVPGALVTSTGKGADLYPLGLLARNGLAPLPASWKNAIWETFFSKITKPAPNNPATIGGTGLWIQDKLPTTPAQIDGNPANTELLSNPSCTAGQGA